jgi:predicted ATPase/tRNA A-37 threonylcarbamoyl transferase component Bud32
MTIINNYQITDKIFESANTLVYRGQRNEDNQPVILKVLKENYPTPAKLTHYRQEYEITCNLNIEGVINTYGLEKYQNTLMIVLEDFGGQSLQKLFNAPLDIAEFLALAIQITEILGEIHAANVIHKDINPSNIILNPTTRQLKIIDFGISTVLPRENPTRKNPNQLEGTLAYLSPEQTGRMNRVLDYRTDFYSLGVTFYELLTQQLPFESQDAMKLVHCHLAKQPTQPHDLNPNIPPVISNIILKLLAKTAEERYQSAWGLKTDLQECKPKFAQDGKFELSLGQHDFSEKLQLPQKLYGRERDIKTLLTAFERASKGQHEMMLVTGYAGIGKSSLVQETHKPITEKRGYFISGKFDQFQRNIPYAAFVNAFTELVRQLLTESEKQLIEWKEKILKAVGPNGPVIIEVIPEVEFIIGQQPDVPQLPPAESQNRFNLVLQNFIKVFTQPEHPLVIFLDDLQWVDSASLKLMQLLMESADIHALFLIGAYRDNEVNAIHPLRLTLKEIQKAKAVVNQILLEPLALEHVNQLIADALHCDLGRAFPLAELVHTKTGGNPFFMNEFLKSLSDEKLLTYEPGSWQWDLPQIQTRNFTNNVVELMVGKIKQLSAETQDALKFAACIGNQFDLTTLATVLEKTPQKTVADLQQAFINGQLLATNKRLLTEIDLETDNWSLITESRFAHDRIQQAAYSLISAEQKPVVHHKIGQLLLKNIPLDEREHKIFAIVDQLNVGKELINQQSERDELAQLNLIAGKKAKASAAYQPAFDYLKKGLELLGADSWQTQYNLILVLHEEAAEAAYLNGHFDLMETWIEVVLRQAKTVLDKVKVYEVKMQAYQAQNQLEDALRTGLQVLQLLGIKFPKIPRKWHILLGLLRIELALLGKRTENLINLQKMTEREQKATMRIMAKTAIYANMSVGEFFVLIVLKMVDLSLRKGNVPESALGYLGYAMILCGSGKIETGYQFGKLALNLLARFKVKEYKAKIDYAYYIMIKPWKCHFSESIEPLLRTYQNGLNTGDWEFAGYAMNGNYLFSHQFNELSELEPAMRLWSDTLNQLKQGRVLQNFQKEHQFVLRLIGDCAISNSLTANNQTKNLKSHDKTFLFLSSYSEFFFCYLFEDYPHALNYAFQTEKYLGGVRSFPYFAIFHFYDSLVRLVLYDTATKQEQRQYRDKIQANQKKMKNWAHHAPMNYLHKFDLVEAEWHHHVLGEDAKAMDLYDKAIAGARENEYLNEEALAYELAAKFYLAKGKDKIAQVYFKDAHYAYTRWGALAKVKHLEEHYLQLFDNLDSAPKCSATLSATKFLAVKKAVMYNSTHLFYVKSTNFLSVHKDTNNENRNIHHS